MKRVLLLLSIIALTLLAACSGKDINPGITVSTNEMQIKSQGDLVTFDITADINWRVTSQQDWIKFAPITPSGSSDATINVIIAQNSSTESRTGEIIIISSGNPAARISVKQDGMGVTVTPSTITFSKDGGTQSVEISTDGPWTATSDGSSWYSFTPTSGNGNSTIQVTADAHTGEFARNAELIFNQGANDENRVPVLQRGGKDRYSDGEVILYKQNTKGNKPTHLIIMGDGYIASDYDIEGGDFIKMADAMVDAFFALEPYKSYKDYFRISLVAGYSQEQGSTVKNKFIQEGIGPMTRNTLFKSVMDGGNSTGINCDHDIVFNYARLVPGVSDTELDNAAVLVGINLPVYAGTCHMYAIGRSISLCPVGRTFTQIVQHEAGGHGFGRLRDEYRYYKAEFPAEDKAAIELWRTHAVVGDPFYAYNIDLTGSMTEVHWKHFFALDKYKADVKLFEGACLYELGVWRAEYNSCMNNNIPYFNAPSREAIVRRIMKASNEVFSLESFYEKDVHNPPARTRVEDPSFRPLGKPVFIDY